MKTKYFTSAVSDIGSRRKNNQDSACIQVAKTKIGHMAMAVICDGMGGLEKGELASAEVLKSFVEWFHNTLPELINYFSIHKVSKEWKGMIDCINIKIRNYSIENGIKMGTTLTAMFFHKEEYVIAHVGDSRAYRLGLQRELLTTDHTLVQKELEGGLLTREEACQDSRKHILWQCVGASVYCKPEITTGKVKKDEVFLLCTDGFYHLVSGMEICSGFVCNKMVNERVMKRKINELIKRAIERGETDNITVALVKVVREICQHE